MEQETMELTAREILALAEETENGLLLVFLEEADDGEE